MFCILKIAHKEHNIDKFFNIYKLDIDAVCEGILRVQKM